jgi:hypothetical protein
MDGRIAESFRVLCAKIHDQGPLFPGEDISIDSCIHHLTGRALLAGAWMILGLSVSLLGYFGKSREFRFASLLGTSALYLGGFYLLYIAVAPGPIEAYSTKFQLAVTSGRWFELLFFDLAYGLFFLTSAGFACVYWMADHRRNAPKRT